MVTAKLTRPTSLALSSAFVFALTAAGVALGAGVPALAGRTPPHPTLTGSLGDAAGILTNNLRVLAAPFIAITLRFQNTGYSRRLGDAVAVLVIGASAIPVGIAIARWGAQLLPYIPQLPFEWTALAVAASTWLAARTGTVDISDIARRAALAGTLLVVAAALETWCTPHRHARSTAASTRAIVLRDPVPFAAGRVVACATESCAGEGQSLQGRTLPSPHPSSVPLGPHAGAYRAPSTTRPPQGGNTR